MTVWPLSPIAKRPLISEEKLNDGNRLNFSYEGETFEESKYIILKQKLGNYDLIAEYDLKNFIELYPEFEKDNGLP